MSCTDDTKPQLGARPAHARQGGPPRAPGATRPPRVRALSASALAGRRGPGGVRGFHGQNHGPAWKTTFEVLEPEPDLSWTFPASWRVDPVSPETCFSWRGWTMGDQVLPRGRITQRLLLCNLPCASPGPRDAHWPDTKTRAPIHLVNLHLPHPLPRHPPGAAKQQGADGGPHRRARTGVADTGRPPGDAPPLPPPGTWPAACRPLGREPPRRPAGCGAPDSDTVQELCPKTSDPGLHSPHAPSSPRNGIVRLRLFTWVQTRNPARPAAE